MTFNFYCLKCHQHFESGDWAFGRFGRDKKGKMRGRRKNYFVKAIHECGVSNYRMLSRRERHAIRLDYAEKV